MGILNLFSDESDPTPAPQVSDAGGLLTKGADEQLPTASEYLSLLLRDRVASVPDGAITTDSLGHPSYMNYLLDDVRYEFALPAVGRSDDVKSGFQTKVDPFAPNYNTPSHFDRADQLFDNYNVGDLAGILRQIEAVPSEKRTPQMESLMLDIPNYLRTRTGF